MSDIEISSKNKAFGDATESPLIVAYQSHQDALRFLSSSLAQVNGAALLQGPLGSGKSTIVREQLDWSQRDAKVAMLDGRRLRPQSLAANMLSQFGADNVQQHDDQVLQAANRFLTREMRDEPAPILFIDNFDAAPESTQRVLNWLAGLETHGRYALRIVLTGKAQLTSLVRMNSLRDLARRNPATYTLNPLTEKETVIYLRTRLIAAGFEHTEKLFPIELCRQLRERSQGWPGQLNKLALEVLDRISELRSARAMPRVIVTRDGDTVAIHELTKRQYTIGRGELADIVIEDRFVSKLHAMLKLYGNALVLLDLNSTNGTIVNSIEKQKTILRSNDIISLGRHRIKIENAPSISEEVEQQIRAADTLTMQNLADIRRVRAKHNIAALKHKRAD